LEREFRFDLPRILGEADFGGGAQAAEIVLEHGVDHARDRRNSRSADLRPLVAGTPFAGDSDFDNTSTDSIWSEFLRLTTSFAPSSTSASVNGVNLVPSTGTTAGYFHIQPTANGSCVASTPYADTCWDNGTLSTASTDNNLKYDVNDVRTIMGRNDRINLFGFFNHEFDSGLEFFAEAGWYRADYQSQREQDTALASQRLIVPANGYYNPFGPVGSAFRIPGLSGVLTTGVPLELIDYRPVDAGPLVVNVRNDTTRFLAGFRGEVLGFDFDSAALYSRARTADSMRTVSLTKFQEALSRLDASAYNPFNGGDPLNPGRYDTTPNSQAIVDTFMVDIGRVSTTELAMGDFKISKNDLFTLPGGRVGMAAGVEFRHETFADDRDDRLDGTIVFTALDGSSNGSDTMGASPTPDSSGARDTISGFLEFAVPLVAPSMNVPLIHSLDVQLAGRVESYQGFNTVAKPKVAASWYPFANLQLRGSWSQGFRAPNLPQLFENGIQRSNTRTDWIRCEADRRNLVANAFTTCGDRTGRTQGVVSNRSGSQDLTPEESDNLSLGGTFQLNMGKIGRLTFTADYWEIRQKNVIGLFGDGNALILDYLLRLQGSSNPNVQRIAPTQADIDAFAGTGIAPVGRIVQVIDNYTNLSPRAVRGYDLGVYYQVKDTGIGDFSVRANAARLLEFYQVPNAETQALIDAQAAGTIAPSIIIAGAQDLVEQNGRPKWRASASVTWRYKGFGLGYFGSYTGAVTDTSASLADTAGTRFRVDDYMTHSLYAQYEVDGGPMDSLRLRVGARNLFNTLAPIADNSNGYIGDLYGNRGRQIYFSVSKRF
ncbi:MAG: TonB-dependent receptor, partial [Sphingomonadales bacterium]